MKRVNKLIRALVMVAVVCAMLTSFVFAAGGGSLWIRNTESEQGTTSWIVTDAVVTDGQVEITYDPDVLTFVDVVSSEATVAMYAVNADESGLVKIAWVAPGEISAEEGQWLFQVNFTGAGSVSVSGTVNGGETGDFAPLNTVELEKAILEAEGLSQENYSADSWNVLEEALADAKDVLADPTASQDDVDAALEALNSAMDALKPVSTKTDRAKLYKAILKAQGLRESKYTAESWAELEEALAHAKKVNASRKATQKQIDDATNALNDAIDNLELKPVEPSEPSQPGHPGGSIVGEIIGKWIGLIKKFFGGWGK